MFEVLDSDLVLLQSKMTIEQCSLRLEGILGENSKTLDLNSKLHFRSLSHRFVAEEELQSGYSIAIWKADEWI